MGDTSKYEEYEYDDYSADEAYRKYLKEAPKREYQEHLKKYPKSSKKNDEQTAGCFFGGVAVIVGIIVVLFIILSLIGK